MIYSSIIIAQGWEWTHHDSSVDCFFFFPYICWARWTETGSSRVTCTARKTAVPPAVLSQYSSCATHVVGYKGQLGASNKSEAFYRIRLFINLHAMCFQQAVLNPHWFTCEGWGYRLTLKQISVYACHLHKHIGDSLGGRAGRCFTLACGWM